MLSSMSLCVAIIHSTMIVICIDVRTWVEPLNENLLYLLQMVGKGPEMALFYLIKNVAFKQSKSIHHLDKQVISFV